MLPWFAHLFAQIFPAQRSNLYSGLKGHCSETVKHLSQLSRLGFFRGGSDYWISYFLVLFWLQSIGRLRFLILFLFHILMRSALYFWHPHFQQFSIDPLFEWAVHQDFSEVPSFPPSTLNDHPLFLPVRQWRHQVLHLFFSVRILLRLLRMLVSCWCLGGIGMVWL